MLGILDGRMLFLWVGNPVLPANVKFRFGASAREDCGEVKRERRKCNGWCR